MHKDFYASGFLYHSETQQILLRQANTADDKPLWSLVGRQADGGKTGEETIRDIFLEDLNIKLKLRSINCIYTYESKEKNMDHNIYYAEVKKLHKSKGAKTEFSWFNLKQILKLNISEQTRHDIVVGLRVIDSDIRKSLGQRTIG
jgi:hypothetical protein